MDKATTERTNYKEYRMDEEKRLKELKINPLHYIQLKENGYKDSQIAKMWEMDFTKLNQKLDHWNFLGLKPSSMKQILNKKTTKAQRENMQKAIDEELPPAESADLEPLSVANGALPTVEKTEFEPLPAGTVVLNEEATKELIEKEKEKEAKNKKVETISEVAEDSPEHILQQTIKELGQQMQTLTQENSDLGEENQKLSQAKEGISRDYEKLQKEHEELVQQYKDMQFQLQNIQSKQTTYMIEEKLEETYQELQAARQDLEAYAEANQKLQMEKESWTNRYIDEKQRHEDLSAYTKRLMPS